MSIIFDSFFNVLRVTEELEHLKQSARELMGSRAGMAISSFVWNRDEEMAGSGKWLCQWTSIGADVSQSGAKGSLLIGRALLCIDLYRDRRSDALSQKLNHAEAPLLTCAFIAGQNISEQDAYNVEYLKFDACGWPIMYGSFEGHAGGRLLEYKESKKESRSWAKRSWLFTVPLEALPNPRAFRAQISDTFWAVLQNGPEAAFPADSSACRFPTERSLNEAIER